MSAALSTIITKWMIPRMGAKLIRVEAFKGNVGSVRVFEKNGFVLEETVDFEKMINLDGIAVVNIVANPSDARRTGKKQLQTRITHNDGEHCFRRSS